MAGQSGKGHLGLGKLVVILFVGVALAAAVYFGWRARFPPAPRDAITIALPMHPTSLLEYVALDRGYFAANGLDVSVKEYPSGQKALEDGLFAGKADIAWGNEVYLTMAGLERSDFRIVACVLGADNVNGIVVRRDRHIGRPEDLRGKRIGTQEASGLHFFLHLFLLEQGLTERNVRLFFRPVEELPAALAAGTIVAASLREPFLSRAKALLGKKALVFEAPGLYEQMDLMVMRRDIVDRSPRITQKALRAMLDAEAFVASHPEEAVAIAAKRLNIDPAALRELLPSFRSHVSLSQSMVILLEEEARWAMKAGLTDRTDMPDYLGLIDTEDLRLLRPEVVTIVR